jgi:hypothetical protein
METFAHQLGLIHETGDALFGCDHMSGRNCFVLTQAPGMEFVDRGDSWDLNLI